jgi:PhoPQ-activated pathogenicity-related protein
MRAKAQRVQCLVGLGLLSLLSAALTFSGGCDENMVPQSEPPPSRPPPSDPPEEPLTELDRYVKSKDPTYSWSLRQTVMGPGYTAYLIDMKSVTWRTAAEVDRTQWQHNLAIVKPDNLTPGPSLLLISGGSNSGAPPTTAPALAVQLAKATGRMIVNLGQVPNQPLTFANHDGMPHTEDGIIAFSWAQVIKKSDPTWSARFPMVKSAVLALDTAQEFLRSAAGGGLQVDKFVVAGASKRGWTTWLTAAVDRRVVGAVPIVIDVLNVEKFMIQHFESYGFWASSLYDYVYNHITEYIGQKELTFMLANEDPYLFRKRLTMPKFIVNASGDQFFLPDGSQNYFDDLPGEKYLRYVPNADHSLDGTDAIEGVAAYLQSLDDTVPRPRFSWKFEGSETLRVQTLDKPDKVLLWQATNPLSRDFRVEKIGKVWQSSELPDQGGGVYRATVPTPAKGYSAFFIELTFANAPRLPLKFTTQVRVLPEARPFAGQDPRTGQLEK